MAENILIQRGGPDAANVGQQGTYPVNAPSPGCRLYPASHTMGRSHSDRISIDNSNESLMCYLMAQGIEVGTNIYLLMAPMGVWMNTANIRLTQNMAGLTFDVELVGLTEMSEQEATAYGCGGIRCSLPNGKFVYGVPDDANVTPLITGVDGDVDLTDHTAQWAGEYMWPRTPVAFMKENMIVRLKITAIPAEGVFGNECVGKSLGIEASVNYHDPCFVESFWGDCGTGTCG